MSDDRPTPAASHVVVRALAGVLALGLVYAVVRLAWISDDAYISLRSVENFLLGHGPVWNVGERVQTYTHPLWFWLLVGARWLSGEHYYTTIAVSILLSLAGAALMCRRARTAYGCVAVLIALLGSRAFCDYATSGLETPLVIVLLSILVWLVAGPPRETPRLVLVTLLVALIATTRLDLVILAGPVVLSQLRRGAPSAKAWRVLLGLAPMIAWFVFATFYYGSPFPITAYAKAFSPGVESSDLVAQGIRYVLHTHRQDPVTVYVVGVGCVAGLFSRGAAPRLLSLGVALYCGYVIRVGGDFMAGRFFVPPFVVALGLLAGLLSRLSSAASVVAALCFGVMAWFPERPNYLYAPVSDNPRPEVTGITDERRFYYSVHGLFSEQRFIPEYGIYSDALHRQGRDAPIVMSSPVAGSMPYTAGDLFRFVDPTLCDPLLMRLPVPDPSNWRIGHFTRAIPEGYFESVAFGENRLRHEGARRFFDVLRPALSAPLWGRERAAALWSLWTGSSAGDLASYVAEDYRAPPRVAVDATDLRGVAEKSFWFDDERARLIGRGGLRVRLGEPQRAAALEVLLIAPMQYGFTFRDGDRKVGEVAFLAPDFPGDPPRSREADVLGYLRSLFGLRRYTVTLPADLPTFDVVDVDCVYLPGVQAALGALAARPR